MPDYGIMQDSSIKAASRLEDQLQKMNAFLEEFCDELGRLRHQLDPVLRPDTPVPHSNGGVVDRDVELASNVLLRLKAMEVRFLEMGMIVRNIRERLDV